MKLRSIVCLHILLAAALPMTGCASTPGPTEAEILQIDEILEEVSAQYAEEGARNCISTTQYDSVKIVDEQRLIFRGMGDRAWLNELRHPCRGLRRNDTLLFELRGSSVCSMDSTTVIDKFFMWSRTGPTCFLGKFKPIPPGHVQLLDDLLHGK